MDLVRLALERATDADDAVELITALLDRHGQGGAGEADHAEPYFSSFLIADPQRAWMVETSGRTWAARPVGPGPAPRSRTGSRCATTGRSRRPTSSPAADFHDCRDPGSPTEHADRRLAAPGPCVAARRRRPRPGRPRRRCSATTAATAGAGPAIPTARSSPPPPADAPSPNGVTVCMHLRDYQATTASMVAELPADPDAPIRAWVALGSPCASVYVPVFPPLGVPAELARPRAVVGVRGAAAGGRGPDGRAALARGPRGARPVEARALGGGRRVRGPGRRRRARRVPRAASAPGSSDALRRLGTE